MTGVRSANDLEQMAADFAAEWYEAVQVWSDSTPRSQQAGQFRVGVSDLGFCPERTRRMLAGEVPDRVDRLAAFIGTAVGDFAEQAWIAQHPDWIRQAEVQVQMKVSIDGKDHLIVIPGHPDLVHQDGIVVDGKTDYGLADPDRNGPTKQQQYQRHLYGLGAFEAGLFKPTISLQDVIVGNVWLDRAAEDKRAVANFEYLDLDVIEEAREWLSDVVYHVVENTPAQKVPPRQMCNVVCGYAGPCRGADTDVAGMITDDDIVRQVALYREGQVMESDGKKIKAQAKSHLEGSDGFVLLDDVLFSLRHTWVNETLVPESKRRGYSKIELTPVKKKGGKK